MNIMENLVEQGCNCVVSFALFSGNKQIERVA